MKQNMSLATRSLGPDDGYEHFDEENSKFLAEFLTEGLIHLAILLQNQTKCEPQCAEYRQMIRGIINCLDLFDSYLASEGYGKVLFDSGNYKESVPQNTNSPTMHLSIRLSHRKPNKVDKEIHILESKIDTLNNNIQNLFGEVNRFKNSLQRLSQECSSLQSNCQQQNVIVRKFKLQQDASEQDLLEIKQKLEDLHYATYDGSLIWIIDEFQRKYHQAKSGQQTSVYSPPIYSSPSGYKMRARLDLNGNGDAYGTHMSIFIVICKGEYDPILVWPFAYQVTFCLFDQTGKGRHVIDSFYPDIKSVSFQRPSSEVNIPSGILKFLSSVVLEQQGNDYVSNDKMYIQVKVDFLGTSRSILPYTLSVNPGLPTLEQDAVRSMIIEQHEKIRATLVAQIQANDREVTERSLIPLHPPARTGIAQQLPPSTTNSESISCEEILPK